MKWIKNILITISSLSILNAWLFRFGKQTIFRGGDATSMLAEFEVYGLSETIMYAVGGVKIIASLLLIAGIFYDKLVIPSAAVIGTLMLGAVAMHFKVQDAWIKFFPAGLFLIFSLTIIYLQRQEK